MLSFVYVARRNYSISEETILRSNSTAGFFGNRIAVLILIQLLLSERLLLSKISKPIFYVTFLAFIS